MKAKLPIQSTLLMALVAVGVAAGACAPESEGETANSPGPGGVSGENGGGGGGGPGGEVAGETPKPMSKVACLRKIALDLTNAAPSTAEIEGVRSGAKSLEDMADVYLASPKFSGVVFDWFRGKFHPTEKVPAGADKEEPARIARYIVTNDVDFRDLVTATYTVNAAGAKATAPPTAAGILTTQSYLSSYSGIANRNWAGHLLTGMAGIVLPAVSNVADGVDASREGLAANPACAGCHVHAVYGVDRAAAFRDCHNEAGLAIAGCTPKEDLPFLGQTGRTLGDLGKILTNSVEWRATMIQTFYLRLGGRLIAKNELAQYRESEAAWIAAGYKPKALLKQIVTSDKYCSR